MFSINRFDFNENAPGQISELKSGRKNIGENWPVVYIISDESEAYVGETVSACRRTEQHLQNEERKKLTEIRIISDTDFNKSVVLDLESFLIRHMSSDGKYRLQNGNAGLQNHDYFNKSEYEKEFRRIWNALLKEGVVTQSINDIENSELFKYSPYKSLGMEQRDAEMQIVKALAEHRQSGRQTTILVRGGAGTGKTILAIYLLKLFADVEKVPYRELSPEESTEEDIEALFVAENIAGLSKLGIVIPQKSLQLSLKDVFKTVNGLDPRMVLSPTEVVDDFVSTGRKFDLLLVDEAHRLKCRDKGHLSFYGKFDECNRLLGLDKFKGTELDWIIRCSENRILFRDELQTVRPCDIDAERFTELLTPQNNGVLVETALSRQWRCLGGNEYIDYVNDVLSGREPMRQTFEEYDVKLFLDVEKMISEIKKKDSEMGLCRTAAGYAWRWNTKASNRKKHPDWPDYDIEIQGHRYRWNSIYENWIGTPNAVNEIGCIHTVQGYDLNYAGIIIGEDIRYNRDTCRIEADKERYFDQQGKSGVADHPDLLREYLLNIYLTLLTRGIRGTYIYVCDDALREYMARFFEVAE